MQFNRHKQMLRLRLIGSISLILNIFIKLVNIQNNGYTEFFLYVSVLSFLAIISINLVNFLKKYYYK